MPCFGPNWPDDTLLTATGGQVYSPATRFHSVLPDGRDTYTVKWIGVYLANRLTTAVTTRHPAGIHTVGHLRAECANRSRRHIERTLGTLTLMRVPIVASTTVSVVTTVGCRISVDSTCYWRWFASPMQQLAIFLTASGDPPWTRGNGVAVVRRKPGVQ